MSRKKLTIAKLKVINNFMENFSRDEMVLIKNIVGLTFTSCPRGIDLDNVGTCGYMKIDCIECWHKAIKNKLKER